MEDEVPCGKRHSRHRTRKAYGARYPGALGLFQDFGRRKHIEKGRDTAHPIRFASVGAHCPSMIDKE